MRTKSPQTLRSRRQDVKVEQVSGMEQIEVAFNRQEMARYGINIADANELMETAIAGKEATRVVDGQMRIATVVRFPESTRSDIPAIKRLCLLGAPAGEQVPLGRIAAISLVEGPAQITREKEHAARGCGSQYPGQRSGRLCR